MQFGGKVSVTMGKVMVKFTALPPLPLQEFWESKKPPLLAFVTN